MRSNQWLVRLAVGICGLLIALMVVGFIRGGGPAGIPGWLCVGSSAIVCVAMMLVGLGVIKIDTLKESRIARDLRNKKGYLGSVLIGCGIGAVCILGGWGLYSGSADNQFTCSVGFLPCPVVGISLIMVGLGVAIAGLAGKLTTSK